MKGLKIVVIGGGSSYTPELVEGLLLRKKSLPVSELWLVDVEEGKEKVEIIAELTKRMMKKENVDTKVFTTLNRREALVDADFVITQFRVGFLDARAKDESIPLALGMIGQETNGAGGMFKALRTIPVIFSIVEDMKELCPDAWLINFTNPAGIITEAIINDAKYPKTIGLCNNPINMKYEIAALVNTDVEKVRLELQGLNHHNFITKVFVENNDITAMLYDSLVNNPEFAIEVPFSKEYLLGIKAIPNDYLKYYVDTAHMLEKLLEQYHEGTNRALLVKEVETKLFEKYKDPNLDVKPTELSKRGGARYSEAACQLIDSIYNDKGDIQYVNTQNGKAVSNFDENYVIECACVIGKDGAKPLPIGSFDQKLMGTITNIKAFERMTIEAIKNKDRNLAIAALCMNPLVPDEKLAKEVFEQLYEAHKKYLPEFK